MEPQPHLAQVVLQVQVEPRLHLPLLGLQVHLVYQEEVVLLPQVPLQVLQDLQAHLVHQVYLVVVVLVLHQHLQVHQEHLLLLVHQEPRV